MLLQLSIAVSGLDRLVLWHHEITGDSMDLVMFVHMGMLWELWWLSQQNSE